MMNKITRKNTRQFLKSGVFISAVSGAIGAVIFLLIYGIQVLNPTNVDWLLDGGDLAQHYLGWEFYRMSHWTFPIGVSGMLAYPHGLAVTFMDSIPLVAIPMKVIGGILPQHFQYFGWWGLASFIAMGVIASLIMRRWTKDPRIILLASLFFCFSPIVFQRMFVHTALAGQWVIMLGIYGVVSAKLWNDKKNTIIWSIILSLSVLVHPYFLPMNIFFLGIALIIRYKDSLRFAINAAVPLLCAFLTIWVIGGFTVQDLNSQEAVQAGYDFASAFTPLPNGWSAFNWSNANVNGEAFGYFGIGGLILFISAIVVGVMNRKRLTASIRAHKEKYALLAALFILMVIIATGPTIRFADIQIFHYHVPHKIEKIWAEFRVTARLAWALYYLVFAASLFVLVRFTKNRRLLIVLLAIICLIQSYDIIDSPQMRARHKQFESVQNIHFKDTLKDPRWNELSQGKKHMVFLADLYNPRFENVGQFCVTHHLTLNTGYFARFPSVAIANTVNEAKQGLLNGTIPNDTIYVSDAPYAVASNLKQQTLNGYVVTVR